MIITNKAYIFVTSNLNNRSHTKPQRAMNANITPANTLNFEFSDWMNNQAYVVCVSTSKAVDLAFWTPNGIVFKSGKSIQDYPGLPANG